MEHDGERGVPKGDRPLPTGLTRWFFQAPAYLYRVRMGWLLGGRFVLLHHVGRKSGLPRETVVEVVRRDAEADAYYICSGFGEKSQWLRNVLAHPEIRIEVGRRRTDARAERLTPDEGEDEMVDYSRRHPRAARKLAGYMGFETDGSEASYRELGRTMPFLRLTPTG